MTLKEALKQLESLGDEKVRTLNAKNGAGKNQFGVKRGDIRKVADKFKGDHEVAFVLWQNGVPLLALVRKAAMRGTVNYRDIITVEPGKRSGKPCIRGLRITVFDVLDYLAAGMTHAQILAEFPYLTEDDIRACLAYAADRERRLVVAGG